ncbi:MAG: hypothetical protein BWY31_03058 [Lentisphaerae bacterium ADurb.Bin242]|nr:MAG: hypothetical protein BWY31_03058 [Lentisphaerae bacterium ADurb.Bin242]
MVIQGKHLLIAAGILILLGAVAFGMWYYLRPTDENRIRGQFRTFSGLAAKKGNEGLIAAAGTAQAISKLFTDKTTFEVEGLAWDSGLYSREHIAANVLRGRAFFDSLQLSFDDIEIEVSGQTARVFNSAVLSGTLRDGKKIREVRDLETILKKTGDEWLFDSFKVREIIKK